MYDVGECVAFVPVDHLFDIALVFVTAFCTTVPVNVNDFISIKALIILRLNTDLDEIQTNTVSFNNI